MSKETLQWLNQSVLVGMTSKRGNAWHYRASEQGAESNHYAGAIPIEDVQRRLFNWQAIELPLSVCIPATLDDMTGMSDEGQPIKTVVLSDRKAIATSDTHEVLGVFKSGYRPHQYDEWLLANVGTILDDDLIISSAGLLKNRAVAWVEVSVPDSIETPEGVTFRPNLLACTSFDGSIATTYRRTIQLVVCDNTLAAANGEKTDQVFKVRHSSKSLNRIGEARDALGIIYAMADDFQAQITQWTNTTVTDSQWQQVLSALVPFPTEKGRGLTLAETKRIQLDNLYAWDSRVAPWKGTAFGVLQAFNTWEHHVKSVRSSTVRAERNMMSAIDGTGETSDRKVLETLASLSN